MAVKYEKGDKISYKAKDGTPMKGVVKRHSSDGSVVINGDNGSRAVREPHEVILIGKSTDALDEVNAPSDFIPPSEKLKNYNINQKFDYLAQLVRMVVSKTSVSLIVTGEGGLGKTYTVKHQLMKKKLVKNEDYLYVKGFSTARGLYVTLYENSEKLIVFDDCDDILDDKTACNLLKGALDSYDEREISWISQSFNDNIPSSFEFSGTVIFISNKNQESISQALLSRSMCIDLAMSRDEKLERMKFIVENSRDFMGIYKMDVKRQALQIIEDNLDDIRELSLRSVEKVVKILSGDKDLLNTDDEDYKNIDLKDLAKFMLLS